MRPAITFLNIQLSNSRVTNISSSSLEFSCFPISVPLFYDKLLMQYHSISSVPASQPAPEKYQNFSIQIK